MRLFLLFLFLGLSFEISAQRDISKMIYESLDSTVQEMIDSVVFSKIPYDSLSAQKDIDSGIVRVITIECHGSTANTNEELEQVENIFGFKYYFDCLEELPNHLLLIKQNEYNNVVFNYLDSINHFDTESSIRIELIRLFLEREYRSTLTDTELFKLVRKALKGEKKEIKKQVYQAELLYRDRQFQKAYKMFREIDSKKVRTVNYLINSQYHCLMNLQEFDKAKAFYLDNKTIINKKFKFINIK